MSNFILKFVQSVFMLHDNAWKMITNFYALMILASTSLMLDIEQFVVIFPEFLFLVCLSHLG